MKGWLDKKQEEAVEQEIKMLLHASRDCMRNQCLEPQKYPFVIYDAYYGEAFGVMRGLALLGYGNIQGAINTPTNKKNLRWWLAELESEVLKEENFGGNNECDYCLEKYGKDGAGRTRGTKL